ncbi:MAG TPA: DUF1134 domain-containing protein [Nevskiaceae bacterium]|nr:DUF1134 domain-containing protein [Nevskiaceae bacterium]
MQKLLRTMLLATGFAVFAPVSMAQTGKSATVPPPPPPHEHKEFTSNEVLQKANDFFGSTTKGLAEAIEKLFKDQGRPNAIITGEEGGGAVVVGLRYGHGTLETASGVQRELYWQGPSVGFDVGGNAAKVFTLVYHLPDAEQIYQRFPGVDGSLYFVAGLSINYQRSGDITLAPIRTGVGWRQGASIGYLHYTREKSYNPL